MIPSSDKFWPLIPKWFYLWRAVAIKAKPKTIKNFNIFNPTNYNTNNQIDQINEERPI